LGEGGLKKYLLYAIGEIILVMIAILLALQVNMWNAQRKDTNLEKKIIEGLYKDFLVAKVELRKEKRSLTMQDSAMFRLLDECHPGGTQISRSIMDSLLFFLDARPTFNPPSGNLEDIFTTGKVAVLKNKWLRLLLIRWNSRIEEVRGIENQQGIFMVNRFQPYLDDKMEFRRSLHYSGFSLDSTSFEFDTREMLQDFTFCNLLRRGIYWSNLLQKKYDVIEKDINHLLDFTSWFLFDNDLFFDIGIIGTALGTGWEKSVPMTCIDEAKNIWEITIYLKQGKVKFRNQDQWEISWGGNSFPSGQTNLEEGEAFDIPVEEGNYRIRLYVKDERYEFSKIED